MSHYVMSDLHGEMDRFHAMLSKIQFSDSDTLYILGDVVDRGPHGIEILRQIMAAPNMVMLLGNHDYMMLRYFSPDATDREIRHWNINGNAPTVAGFRCLTAEQQQETLGFVAGLPTHIRTEVAGKRYYLVHGFPGENLHDEIWGRPHVNTPNPVPGHTLILGHTPVLEIDRTEEQTEAYVTQLLAQGDHARILHAPGFLDLDCSCGYGFPVRRLSCLRLEDMAEFYT